jgi:hypothetical protein
MLAATLAVLLVVTSLGLLSGPTWRPNRAPHAPWCPAGETPVFRFGFAELAQDLGSAMGQPVECEHGIRFTDDTQQQTTTGVAIYRWCANAPTFNRGQEHWLLAPGGLQHWTDQQPAPPLAIVRAPDLRHPCPS